MDLLEQPDIRETYDKCKYIVKLWEHTFVKKNKRLPSKLDIREANEQVKKAYKKYFQLKTAALEQSFIDVDGFDDEKNESGKEEDGENKISISNSKEQEENNSSYCVQPKPDTHNDVENSNLSDVWGPHLNKKKEEDKPNVKNEKAVTANLSITKKLFCGSKFSKRNPRKSLSFSQKSRSDVSIDSPISLSQPTSAISSFTFVSEEAISLAEEPNPCKQKSFQIVNSTEKIVSQPINIIQSVLENNYQHSLKTVDSGWLQRVVENVGTSIDVKELSESSNSTKKYPSPLKDIELTKIDYDSEDIIDDSDDDVSTKDVFHIAKKRKMEEIFTQTNIGSNSVAYDCLPHELGRSKEEMEYKESHSVNSDVSRNDVRKGVNSKTEEINATATEQIVERNPKSAPQIQQQLVQKPSKVNKRNTLKPGTPNRNVAIKQNTEHSPRRSSRETKSKINFQELLSDEEDAFHTDTDDQDPEFSLDSSKSKRLGNIFQQSVDISENESPIMTKISKNKNKSKRKGKKEETIDETKNIDENTPYEMEFSIKPRIVAPRCSNIKKVLAESLTAEKAQVGKNCEVVVKEDNTIKDKTQQAKERLEKKIASGNLNDNFILVNLKKKVYVRGKSNKSFSKYKKAQWKSKKAKALSGPEMDMGGCDGGMLTCFNCGQTGHFARNCKALNGDGLLPLAAEQEEECPYPTLEEASQSAKESVLRVRLPKLILTPKEDVNKVKNESVEDSSPLNHHVENIDGIEEGIKDISFDDDIDEQLLLETLKLEEHVKKLDVQLYMDSVKVVNPYFELNTDGSTIATPSEVYEALKMFGHSSFRPGQEQAVMRILSGKSTLVTLSTGSGKSLCYQLPAYLYSKREPCISLIISPLVSLMDDQVTGIPKFMKAACLHSNQTKSQRQKILEAISMGELSVLLVSPEAVVAGEKQIGFGSLLRKLPPIAFACIDEAHCVSQWSHNFRPSYLMICRVLRESLGVKTILGLTATATRATRDSIINHLQIPDGHEGVISDVPLPDNLVLTASKDQMRDRALLGLLLSERFADCKSIIVYCTRRDECERIASFLRTSLKSEQIVEASSKKRKRVNLQAEPYHAGLSASRRRTIQNKFMSGELRIVVATVAFGMGINKSDIRAVIHYNMPNSFESYVQEVGRAGRDGLMAQCHVFMDSQGRDENELRRHIHANSIDRHVIRKLLQKVFIPCSCTNKCPKHEVAFSIEETVKMLDIPEENIATLLCYLELHENRYVELLSPAYTICKVISYNGPMEIRKASKECPPLAMALALHKSKSGDNPNILEFPVVDVAAAMGWDSGICKHKLKNLEWTTVNNQQKRSAISVQFSNLGFRLFAPGNLSDDELDNTLDNLHNRVTDQERKALLQLHAIHKTLMDITQPSYSSCTSKESDSLIKTKVREYFNSPDPLKFITEIEPSKFNEEQLVNDIRALICMYKDNTFTGRAVARIFQGIQSPNYPATMWGRCKFWRSHLNLDFHTIVKIATREIIKMR